MRRVLAVLALLAVAGCGSGAAAGTPSSAAGAPSAAGSPSANPYVQAQQQENVKTCNTFGDYLLGIPSNSGPTDVAVVDAATGTNGVTYQVTPASPALQALVNKWDDQVQNFYDNNGNNETSGPAVEKTDRLVTDYGNQIEAWCATNAGVNLSAAGSTNPAVWATEGP